MPRLIVPPLDTSVGFVSRAGVKLHAALTALQLNIRGFIAADLGSHVGGFVDCLLVHGAARVYAVDTAYGVLAWKLRRDPRVIVMERRNALHLALPEKVDLLTIDVGWTRQEKILPVAAGLVRPGGSILTLVKPHYESEAAVRQRGVLTEAQALDELAKVAENIRKMDLAISSMVKSPITGHGGNNEFILLLRTGAAGR